MRVALNKTNEEVDKIAGDSVEKQKNPLLDKTFFLDEVIKQRIVYFKAEKEKVLSNEEYVFVGLLSVRIFDTCRISDLSFQLGSALFMWNAIGNNKTGLSNLYETSTAHG